MDQKNSLDIDRILDKLLEVRGSKPGKQVNLSEKDIRSLCIKARDIFIDQPILLEIEAPIKVCGNTNIQLILFFKVTHMDSTMIF